MKPFSLSVLLFLSCIRLSTPSIPVTVPVKSVEQQRPPTVAPRNDYDFGSSPPLPQYPDKTYLVHHDPSYFPDSIFDRPRDKSQRIRPPAKDIQPRPSGRWLHTLVEVDGTIFLYGGVIKPKTLLNDMWVYTPAKETWNQKQRPTLPMQVVPPGDKYKDDPEQGRPSFAPEPPDMRALPAEDNGAKTRIHMDPDGGEAPPEEMDPDVSLPIYKTPVMPVLNPLQPVAQSADAAADGGPAKSAGASDKKSSLSKSPFGRRRRLLINQITKFPSTTLTPGLPTTSALLRGRTVQDPDSVVMIKDFWEFDIQANSWLVIRPDEKKNPPRRSLHTALAVGTKMIVFGGVSDNNVLLNDIWTYDVKTRAWEEIDVGHATNRPMPREGHVAVAGPFEPASSFTIHGGMGYGYVPFEDTWTFEMSTATWTQVAVVENVEKEWVPPGRWMHSAVTIDKVMYMFGGCSKDYSPMEDIWKLELDSSKTDAKWERIEPIGFPPPGRWLHTADVILSDVGKPGSHAMVIYAGATNNSPLQDMWIFRPDDNSWVEVETILDIPFAREGHASCMLKPSAAAKKLLRRRRLLMDGPGDVDISTGALSELPDVAIDGPNKADSAKELLNMGPKIVAATSTSQIMFVFGGSSEPGLVSEVQDPSPI